MKYLFDEYKALVNSMENEAIKIDLLSLSGDMFSVFAYLEANEMLQSDNPLVLKLLIIITEYSLSINENFSELYKIMIKKLKDQTEISYKILLVKIMKKLSYSNQLIDAYVNHIVTGISEATEQNAIIMELLLDLAPTNLKLLNKVSLYSYYVYDNLEGACTLLDRALEINNKNVDIYLSYCSILDDKIKSLVKAKKDKEIINGHCFHLNQIYDQLIKLSYTFDTNEITKKTFWKKYNNFKTIYEKSELKLEIKKYFDQKQDDHLCDTIKLVYCKTILYCSSEDEIKISNKLEINRILSSTNYNNLSLYEKDVYDNLKIKCKLKF